MIGSLKKSDLSSAGSALAFGLSYFGYSDETLAQVAGRRGYELMTWLWKNQGEGMYQDPRYLLRQEWFHAFGEPVRRLPLFFEHLSADAEVLDYGCGTAELCRQDWIERGGRMTLLDTEGIVQPYLRAKYPMDTVGMGTVENGLIGQFDAIVCTDVFEHVPNPMDLVTMLWDHLKPGGQALFWFDHSHPHPGHLQGAIQQLPAYERWISDHAIVRYRHHVDWLEKPQPLLRKVYVTVKRFFTN